MHETERVDELDRGRGREAYMRLTTDGSAAMPDQQRTESLAPSQHGVFHRFVEASREISAKSGAVDLLG